MSKTTKSGIWNYFIKTEFGGTCKQCSLHVKSSGNTTNLHNHMKRKYEHLYDVSNKVNRLKENERLCDDTDDGDQQMHVCWCWLY